MSLAAPPTSQHEHLLARVVPGALFALVFFLDVRGLVLAHHHSPIHLVAQVLYVVFVGMVVVLTIVRDEAAAIDRRAAPWLASVLGTFGLAASPIIFTDHGPRLYNLGNVGAEIEAVLAFVAIIGAVISLAALGKAFSVTPQASHLVVRGPYRIVRNPVYFFEGLATIGGLIDHGRVLSIVIVVIVLGSQLVRIHYEEQLLSKVFPEYDEAFRGIPRLIPGVY